MRGGSIRVTAIALLLAASAAGAGAPTDVVVLKNRDRFTDEVRYMRCGKLQVKTDDLGTLQIERNKVASVTTARPYDITNRSLDDAWRVRNGYAKFTGDLSEFLFCQRVRCVRQQAHVGGCQAERLWRLRLVWMDVLTC